MQSLNTLREGWGAFEAEEISMLQAMTLQEGLEHFFALQQAWESQFQQTEDLLAQDRRAALAVLQERLGRLAAWQEQHARAVQRN